jgi:hypothetical protein
MATVQDLIYTALRSLGIGLNPGQTPNTAELSDGLAILNRMTNAWATERLTMFTSARTVQNLVAGQQVYQMGPGAPDWDMPRPQYLDGAGLILTNEDPAEEYETPLVILRTDTEWQRVTVKALPSTLPVALYMEPDWPYAQVALWPAPTAINQIALYVPQAVSQFSSLSDTVSLPPGYEEALVYSLAIHLAPAWNTEVPATVAALAMSAKDSLKRANVVATMGRLRVDPALQSRRGCWDWVLGVER